MERRHRTVAVFLAAASVTAVGVGLAALAHVAAGGAETQAGRLPRVTRFMPADSGIVLYGNLAAVLESPLADHWSAGTGGRYPDELERFQDWTGIDPRVDLDTACITWGRRQNAEQDPIGLGTDWGLAVTGNLQPERLIASIERELSRPEAKATFERTVHRTTPLYLFRFKQSPSRRADTQALAFPDPSTALFGTPERLKEMLDAGSGRAAPFAGSALGRWFEGLAHGDEELWVAGSAERGLARLWPRQGGTSAPLPPLKFFALSAHLGPALEAAAHGEAVDAESARKLADVVRGFIALGSLQQQREAEVVALLNAVQIQSAENRVEMSLTIPYETLSRLATRKRKAADQ
jgi:hypothetical protein